ncbi:MAG: hypothetical protein ACRC92_20325 [Peptostreptococcaceae bacterium]
MILNGSIKATHREDSTYSYDEFIAKVEKDYSRFLNAEEIILDVFSAFFKEPATVVERYAIAPVLDNNIYYDITVMCKGTKFEITNLDLDGRRKNKFISRICSYVRRAIKECYDLSYTNSDDILKIEHVTFYSDDVWYVKSMNTVTQYINLRKAVSEKDSSQLSYLTSEQLLYLHINRYSVWQLLNFDVNLEVMRILERLYWNLNPEEKNTICQKHVEK